MVEFISPESPKVEEEPEEPEEPEDSEEPEETQKSLEALVEEQSEAEVETEQESQDYLDEPVIEKGEYFHPDDIPLKDAPLLKDELKPLVYDENDVPIVTDILTRYGKKEDKWWLENVNVGIIK